MKNFLPLKHIKAPPHLLSEPQPTPSQQDIERVFARCFSTEDGKKVLAHLQVMTFSRAYGPDVADNHLRYADCFSRAGGCPASISIAMKRERFPSGIRLSSTVKRNPESFSPLRTTASGMVADG